MEWKIYRLQLFLLLFIKNLGKNIHSLAMYLYHFNKSSFLYLWQNTMGINIALVETVKDFTTNAYEINHVLFYGC